MVLQCNLMDRKTAYLHAPIEFKVYMEQPEDFEVKLNTIEKVYELNTV